MKRIQIEESAKTEIEILEDVQIPGTNIILEKGDKIEIIPKQEDTPVEEQFA
jgi:hypothetical protein